jgi:hypothetical protein
MRNLYAAPCAVGALRKKRRMMMAETIKFKVHKADLMTADHVKIDDEAKEIIRQVQRETGLTARTIVSRMIKFCKDKWEVAEI